MSAVGDPRVTVSTSYPASRDHELGGTPRVTDPAFDPKKLRPLGSQDMYGPRLILPPDLYGPTFTHAGKPAQPDRRPGIAGARGGVEKGRKSQRHDGDRPAQGDRSHWHAMNDARHRLPALCGPCYWGAH